MRIHPAGIPPGKRLFAVVLSLALGAGPAVGQGNFRYECPSHDGVRVPDPFQELLEVPMPGQVDGGFVVPGDDWNPILNAPPIPPTFNLQTQLSVPGFITTIVEFHDCQRLIGKTSAQETGVIPTVYQPSNAAPEKLVYGPLVAIWASPRLGNEIPAGEAIALAELLAFDGSYHPLHIEVGFNCLFAFREGEHFTDLRVYMVPVGPNEERCGETLTPEEVLAEGQQLSVSSVQHTGNLRNSVDADPHVPPVAKWDTDHVAGLNYIGIKCWRGTWCEIFGHPAFESSPKPHTPYFFTPQFRRVTEVKGWSDEQYLAPGPRPDEQYLSHYWSSTGEAPGVYGPLPNFAKIIPNPNLGQYRDISDFTDGEWVNVARVRVVDDPGVYAQKFGFEEQPSVGGPWMTASNNEVELCRGTRNTCNVPSHVVCASQFSLDRGQALRIAEILGIRAGGFEGSREIRFSFVDEVRMWGRIVPPSGVPTYRCVTRRDHAEELERAGFDDIPATARFPWIFDDEGIWIRCALGCCQLH